MQLTNTSINKQISITVDKEPSKNSDAWDNLDIDNIAVDTGIEDFAENHDHYLYGLPKKLRNGS